MTELMKLDPIVLDGYRERFLDRFPDFADFTMRSGQYWAEERQYKEEISSLCQELLSPAVFGSHNASRSEGVFQSVLKILTGKLKSINQPQNIVGWREAAALKTYGPQQKEILAESLGALLYSDGEPAKKIDAFSSRMWPVFKGGSRANPFARSRTIPTFFLMMIHPEHHITVRTKLFDDVSEDFLGRSILDNQVFTGSEYSEILELATVVKGHLQRWGWCPNDMIDVHSFLWRACWEDETESEKLGETA